MSPINTDVWQILAKHKGKIYSKAGSMVKDISIWDAMDILHEIIRDGN